MFFLIAFGIFTNMKLSCFVLYSFIGIKCSHCFYVFLFQFFPFIPTFLRFRYCSYLWFSLVCGNPLIFHIFDNIHIHRIEDIIYVNLFTPPLKSDFVTWTANLVSNWDKEIVLELVIKLHDGSFHLISVFYYFA